MENSVTAKTLPDDETVLIKLFEATMLGEKANTLLSPLQLRKNWLIFMTGIDVIVENNSLIRVVLLFL